MRNEQLTKEKNYHQGQDLSVSKEKVVKFFGEKKKKTQVEVRYAKFNLSVIDR